MMKVRYTGTPGEKHDAIAMYGHAFPLGEWVDVSEPRAQNKLAAHPHFESQAADPIPAAEEAQLGEEFQALVNAQLEPIEADKVARETTIAALTEEDKYGSDDGSTGNADASEAGSPSGERKRGPGRPRKST